MLPLRRRVHSRCVWPGAMVRLTPSQFTELVEAAQELAAQLESEQLQEDRIC